jgi:hypothetical protein
MVHEGGGVFSSILNLDNIWGGGGGIFHMKQELKCVDGWLRLLEFEKSAFVCMISGNFLITVACRNL